MKDNSVKTAVCPKLISMFNVMPSTILAVSSTEIVEVITKLIWKYEGSRIPKKNKFGGLTLLNFKTYCKITATTTM